MTASTAVPGDLPGATGAGAPARVLGQVQGASPGSLLLCVAGIHGNEPAGLVALERVLRALGADPSRLAGEIVGLSGNRAALAAGRRYVSRDLNRLWTPEQVARVRSGAPPADPDEAEQAELDRELCALLARAPAGRTYLLDLHTTSSESPPFVVLDDALRNRAFALALPAPIVLGLEEELPGTLLYHLAGEGLATLGFEGGRHADPGSADRLEAAIWIALEASGVLPKGARPEVEPARRLLAEASRGVPHVVEVRYRHGIVPEDGFRMDPGFRSFQPVAAGERLATDRRGAVAARENALLLMPLYQPQGSDGFFLARPVHPAWLKLSALLRRARLAGVLPLLPGVRRHPEAPDALLVDRRVARWLVREVFHLLGYRREGEEGTALRFRRRAHEP